MEIAVIEKKSDFVFFWAATLFLSLIWSCMVCCMIFHGKFVFFLIYNRFFDFFANNVSIKLNNHKCAFWNHVWLNECLSLRCSSNWLSNLNTWFLIFFVIYYWTIIFYPSSSGRRILKKYYIIIMRLYCITGMVERWDLKKKKSSPRSIYRPTNIVFRWSTEAIIQTDGYNKKKCVCTAAHSSHIVIFYADSKQRVVCVCVLFDVIQSMSLDTRNIM